MSFSYGSICSGVEAATLAWADLDFQAAWFSEIEPFPCAVLAQRWPHVPNHGDMTRLADKILEGAIPAPDILASAGSADPAEILFESEGLQGDIGTGAETGQSSAAYIESSFGSYRESAVAGTVRANGGAASGGSESLVVSVAGNTIGRNGKAGGNGSGFSPSGVCYTLTAADRHAVATAATIRKLTPLECERLQGFPDHYTRIAWRGKSAEECPDTPRYKAIGNSMAVPVMRWIGERIKSVT